VYIPEHFRVRENRAAISFMRAYPFSILVSSTPEGPFATHLPLVVRDIEDGLYLRGHVAKANPHWRYLGENPDCLIIFHGPHSYISPTNYNTREAVPTWNYSAVHAYGKARIFVAPHELLSLLQELIPLFEPAYAEQWASLSDVYRSRMLNHIVGFEIAVTRLEAKFKLSQNRTLEEQERIIQSLSRVVDTNVSGTADLMRKENLGVRPHNP
jgi:transcriptional regulator